MEMKCYICKLTDIETILYGLFFTLKKISVHHFCLILSSGICQKGKDNEDIQGFLLPEIKRFSSRIARKKCHYCKRGHASVKCFKCDHLFHVVCGVKNGCLSEFTNNFNSYCHLHHNIKVETTHAPTNLCVLCYEQMGEFNEINSIQAHCNKNAWMHKYCLMKFAYNTGYGLSCPLCRDKSFRNEIKLRGIFVPDQDVMWEYENQLDLPRAICEAKMCLEIQGREHIDPSRYFYICDSCGKYMHDKCASYNGNGIEKNENFYCFDCKPAIFELEEDLPIPPHDLNINEDDLDDSDIESYNEEKENIARYEKAQMEMANFKLRYFFKSFN